MPIQKPIKLDKKALKKNELAIFVDQVVDYTRKNPKQIIIPLVVVVLAIVFISSTISYFRGQQREAEMKLLEGIQAYHNASQSTDKATQTINFTQCIDLFKNVAGKYGRTKSGEYASLYLADSYYHLGRTDDAIKAYQDIITKHPHSYIAGWAQLSLGYIYANRNDFPKAIAAFDQLVIRQPDSFLVPEALVQLGISYTQVGNFTKAQECFSRVIKTYPTSGWAAEANSRLVALPTINPKV